MLYIRSGEKGTFLMGMELTRDPETICLTPFEKLIHGLRTNLKEAPSPADPALPGKGNRVHDHFIVSARKKEAAGFFVFSPPSTDLLEHRVQRCLR
jgi:hypothetical protein